eukprot:5837386-Amphidinium_carterae.3
MQHVQTSTDDANREVLAEKVRLVSSEVEAQQQCQQLQNEVAKQCSEELERQKHIEALMQAGYSAGFDGRLHSGAGEAIGRVCPNSVRGRTHTRHALNPDHMCISFSPCNPEKFDSAAGISYPAGLSITNRRNSGKPVVLNAQIGKCLVPPALCRLVPHPSHGDPTTSTPTALVFRIMPNTQNDAHMYVQGYEPNGLAETSATAIATNLLKQHTNLFVNVTVPPPQDAPEDVPVLENDAVPMDGVLSFMEEQMKLSRDREQVWQQEFLNSQPQYHQVSNEFETARFQAQEWVAREGVVAQSVLQTYHQEARGSALRLELLQKESNVNHSGYMREVEERERCTQSKNRNQNAQELRES